MTVCRLFSEPLTDWITMVLPFGSVTPAVATARGAAHDGLLLLLLLLGDLPRRLIVFGHRACNGATDGYVLRLRDAAVNVLFRPRLNNIKDLLSNGKDLCREKSP